MGLFLMRDSIDFKNEPVGRIFRKMFLPTLVGMLSMVVLNITDGAFVGHGVNSDALAAVNIVAPIFMVMGGVGLMFGIGSSVVASIHLSKDNVHAANLNLTQGLLISFLIGVAVCIVTTVFQEETCRFFGCSDQLLPLACSYLKWISLMVPLSMFSSTGMFFIRLDGSPRFAMWLNCISAALNILLDYLLIFHTSLGLEGAAIATATAFSIGAFLSLYYMLRKTKTVGLARIKMTKTSLLLSMRNIIYQSKIGLSALLGELAIAAVIIVGNYVFMHHLGEDGVAAFSVGCYCLPIVFMLGNAIVGSVQPILSFAYSQQNTQRLSAALRLSTKIALISGIAGMLGMLFGTDMISTVFLQHGCHAQVLCREGLKYFSPAFLVIAINLVLVGYMQSIEAVWPATTFTILRGFVFPIPIFIFLPELIGPEGLWLAMPTAELLTLLAIGGYLRKKGVHTKATKEKE